MNRWGSLLLVVCVACVACGDDSPSGPSNAPLVYTAQLSPANENPPISNAESSGRGSVQITFDVARSGDTVTGGTATFYFQLSGFPSNTQAIAAHIHTGPQGINGPIVVNSGMAATPLANGITEIRGTAITVNAATMQAIITNPAGHYFNVHSTLNPGGFTRGQLVRTQ